MRPRSIRSAVLASFAAAAVAIAAACSSSPTAPLPKVDLTGSYSLLSFAFGTAPESATGTLVTDTVKYKLDLTLNDTLTLVDSGTYVARGDSIAEHSSTGLPDAVGTFKISGDSLTIDASEAGQRVVTVWQKQ